MDTVRDGLKRVLALRVLALSIVLVVSLTSIYDVVTDHACVLRLYQHVGRTYLADAEDMTIPGGPAGHVDARVIRPVDTTGALPVIMYFHGGAG